MAKIYENVKELIGNTPLVALNNYAKREKINAKILGKLEYFNPAGSVKDRIARKMIEDAEREGKLKAGDMLIEPTSGNTGIGLAALGSALGYKVILTMPDTMSSERRTILKAYGAEIVLTDGARGMRGAIEKAEELSKKHKNSFMPRQFENKSNPLAHYESTGPEIFNDTDGKVDFFVSGVGTGGTITGTGKYLKEKTPDIKVIAVEPFGSPVLSRGKAGSHKIQGIGAGFVPEVLDTDIYDKVFPVTDEDAFATAVTIAKVEGILLGISSGAAIFAATQLAKATENFDKTFVVILPDTGERYLSTPLYS